MDMLQVLGFTRGMMLTPLISFDYIPHKDRGRMVSTYRTENYIDGPDWTHKFEEL
jgi:hypothetical protein